MKNTLILIALFFFSFSNAQGIIHIENYTPYSLYFQLHAELDDSCEYGLYGWNYTYPSGSEYTFDLPPNYPTGSSVTYTSYANAFIQTPNMTHFKKSPGTTLYPYNIAESIYGVLSLFAKDHVYGLFNGYNAGGILSSFKKNKK